MMISPIVVSIKSSLLLFSHRPAAFSGPGCGFHKNFSDVGTIRGQKNSSTKLSRRRGAKTSHSGQSDKRSSLSLCSSSSRPTHTMHPWENSSMRGDLYAFSLSPHFVAAAAHCDINIVEGDVCNKSCTCGAAIHELEDVADKGEGEEREREREDEQHTPAFDDRRWRRVTYEYNA